MSAGEMIYFKYNFVSNIYYQKADNYNQYRNLFFSLKIKM